MFIGIVLTRLLFIACMVFILGYVFGNFSKKRSLTRITKVAAILSIILFITTNIFAFRSANWRHGERRWHGCEIENRDSTLRH
ncbi:MAG TPA: hypothetical protein VK616_09050 [Flavitalea sp.]|nr:hypothetical protein [Flavitalea sp.]